MTPVRAALAVLLLSGAAVLQVTLLAPLGLPGAVPDPTLLVVVALALRWGPLPGAVVGFLGGLLLDAIPPSSGSLGLWATVFLLLGYAVGTLFEDATDSPVVALVAVTGAAALSVVGSAGIALLLGNPAVSGASVPRLCASAVLYDVVLTPVVIPAVSFLARRTERPSEIDPLKRSVRP